MIDFLIAHAQEAFAEKEAFVPPQEEVNELEEEDQQETRSGDDADASVKDPEEPVFSSFRLQARSLSHCTHSSDCSCLIVCELANLFAGQR